MAAQPAGPAMERPLSEGETAEALAVSTRWLRVGGVERAAARSGVQYRDQLAGGPLTR
jgi:hypothetical protein